MSNYRNIVRATITALEAVRYATTGNERSKGIEAAGELKGFTYTMEWRGPEYMKAEALAQYADWMIGWCHDSALDLATQNADESEWEAAADKFLIQLGREVTRAMWESPSNFDPMRLAAWVAKRDALKELARSLRLFDTYCGLDDEDMQAVLDSRRERAEAEAEADRRRITEVKLVKEGKFYARSYRNRYGVEQHSELTEHTRFADAKAAAVADFGASTMKITY